MNVSSMKELLNENLKKIQIELIEIDAMFTAKREQYLKTQGALEALNELEEDL